MYEVIFLSALALIWIIFASVQDLKFREVANWLNFSLIVFALGFRFFWCLFSDSGFAFFYQGLIGLGIFLVLGNLFYYGRLFAGGDAKLMIALGAVLPFYSDFSSNLKVFIAFFVLFIFAGAVYGIIWSVYLLVKDYNLIKKEFAKYFKLFRILVFISVGFGVLFLIFGFFNSIFLILGGFLLVVPFLFVFAKSVESCCMIVKIPTRNLREGDWLFKNLKIGKKTIKANWEGLENSEIKLIKKHFKEVQVKQGIPFVPVFLISFFILAYSIIIGIF